MIADTIVEKYATFCETVAPDGPEAPRAKTWWNKVQPGGPWI
jgi:hypothetical protein